MNIEIAKVCGLCGGCKRAVTIAQNELENYKNVVLFKEIVHNENVNNMLKNKGVKIEYSIENLKSADIVVIRAHGEPPETFEYLNKNGIKYKDCTCFNVKYIHKRVTEYSSLGYDIIIIGKRGKASGKIHPEVYGIKGYVKTNAILIEDEQDLEKLSTDLNKTYLVCQTTFNFAKASDLIDKISKIYQNKGVELISNKSVCPAQKEINKSSAQLAKSSDLMIVVGGANSSNTKELYNNIKTLTKTVFVEDIKDWKLTLKRENIQLFDDIKIGLTAGASTQKDELETLKNLILLDNKQN
ncbi:MAG: 4-hydroxy-3-methylbut-2-enyl diphosphate reductase [Clostridia bacterium]|nr:4-hydroxy-3-methylbut-2-enyl diphosphate reductase [Clostridia bacterium]